MIIRLLGFRMRKQRKDNLLLNKQKTTVCMKCNWLYMESRIAIWIHDYIIRMDRQDRLQLSG